MEGALPGWAVSGGDYWLTVFTFAPVLGMLLILFMPKGTESKMKYVASLFAAVPLVVAILMWGRFISIQDALGGSNPAIVFHEKHHWFTLGQFDVNYEMGVDGLSMSMVILSGLVGFLSTFIHYQTIKMGERGYYALLLLLLAGMNGVFCSLDFFLFFVFWEIMLLPMYFLIGVWGGPDRLYAAIKFFLYTMAGSVLILVAMLALWYYSAGEFTVDPNQTAEVQARQAEAIRTATAKAYALEQINNPAAEIWISDADAAKFQAVPFDYQGYTGPAQNVLTVRTAQFNLAPADADKDHSHPGQRKVLLAYSGGGLPPSTDSLAATPSKLWYLTELRQCRIGELIRMREAAPLSAADQAQLDLGKTANSDNPAASPTALLYAAARNSKFELKRSLNLMDLKFRFELFRTTFHLPVVGAISFANLMFLFLFIGFAIKVPVFPFHTWLPWAHVEAPTAISVILAGILLKMGVYGMLRMNYGIFPTAALYFAVPIGALGVINILYGAFCAMAQKDMKKLVAYSSVSHMGYCMLGLAAVTALGSPARCCRCSTTAPRLR